MRILDSASKVFASHGFERTTMDMVAQDAQMGKASIYHYYPTKQKLFAEMLKQANEKLAKSVNVQISQKSGNEEPNIELILRSTLEVFQEHKELLSLFLTLHAGGTEHLESIVGDELLSEIQQVHRPLITHLAEFLGPDADRIKPIVISFMLGLALRVIHGSDRTMEEEIAVFSKMVQCILGKPS